MAFGDNPYPLHSNRLDELSPHPTGWAQEDELTARLFGFLMGDVAQVCRAHVGPPGYGDSRDQGPGGSYGPMDPSIGTVEIRYRPINEQDALHGAVCGRCGMWCAARTLSLVEHLGKRLCSHCVRLRRDPERDRKDAEKTRSAS